MMGQRIRLEQAHFRRRHPDQPIIKPYAQWLGANRGFYDAFRRWLKEAGYSPSALNIYSVAARLTFGLLDQAYWLLEPQTDLEAVRSYIDAYYDSAGTRTSYYKGLSKLAQYLALRNRQPPPHKPINWACYLAGLPDWLAEAVRAFISHQQRSWLPEDAHQSTVSALSHLTLSLRWLATQTDLTSPAAITPEVWFSYVDVRLAQGIKHSTLNGELGALGALLRYLHDTGVAVCPRMLHLKPFKRTKPLPRDVPPDQLRALQA